MLNPDLAYLFGVYFGDGHIAYVKKPKPAYQFIIVSSDRDFCETCLQICLSNFGKTGLIKVVKNYFKFRFCCKDVCNFILDQTCTNPDYYQATCYEKKGRLPEICSNEHKRQFVIGLLDSDGWIRKVGSRYNKYEIGFKNTSLLSPQFYDIMSDVVRCRKMIIKRNNYRYGKKTKDSFTWTIHPRDFLNEGLQFRVKRKKDLLLKYASKLQGKTLDSDRDTSS